MGNQEIMGKMKCCTMATLKVIRTKKKRRIELLKVYTIPEGKNGEKADSDNERTCV